MNYTGKTYGVYLNEHLSAAFEEYLLKNRLGASEVLRELVKELIIE
jgi:hypothetical protein